MHEVQDVDPEYEGFDQDSPKGCYGKLHGHPQLSYLDPCLSKRYISRWDPPLAEAMS
jgi:hypothetical protein